MKNATPTMIVSRELLSRALVSRALAAFALTALTLAMPVFAADSEVRSACAADFKSLCPDTQPGGGRLKACIKEHRQQLSAECKNALAARRANNPRHRGGSQSPDSSSSGTSSSGTSSGSAARPTPPAQIHRHVPRR